MILIQGQNHNNILKLKKKIFKLSRYPNIESKGNWNYQINKIDGIAFTVSQNLHIAGIGLFTTSFAIDFEIKLIIGFNYKQY